MQIQPINNNKYSNSFGFHIEYRSNVAKYGPKELEKALIQKFQESDWQKAVRKVASEYCPDHTVSITLEHYGHQNAALVAKDLNMGDKAISSTFRLSPDDYTNLFESESPASGCKSFYYLLERLINRHDSGFINRFYGNVTLPPELPPTEEEIYF